ncbi:quinohemoprotein amine dehydrogenase maturation protein [Oceanospirillum sediminis]|uniref:Quinohemoprotein amine dehydrogenase maturation protein n=1 Tax=Oceanospirillum sediminis TaxID=2760088 RepID=A0A839IQ38_9GAMM|nr:quinohemoprotein amine dehydrogenase maturation protein [Oceanospirillum sediminis]MBB1487365.1 quinohemoprotein amine dehydrogenase maturation protein [Oceanospirillum sediminis]
MGAQLRLVEQNLHLVDVDSKSLLFHIPTSSLFELDDLTERLIHELRQTPDLTATMLVTRLAETFPEHQVQEVIREMLSLELISDGSKALTREIAVSQINEFPLNTLVLNVNTGCNLSCSYCYKEDLDKPSAGRKMSLETAKQSIEMLLQESPDEARYNLVFFGGEPLSNFGLIVDVVNYAERRFAQFGKPVDFTMTTNATLLTEEIVDWLAVHRFGLSVSMDGPKAIHDKNRITVGGQGTYDVVSRKARMLLERYSQRPIGARVTLTRGITDIERIWQHLFQDMGFAEVGFAPVTSGDIASFNLTQQELADVFAGMKRLGEYYLTEALQHRNIGFSNMHQLITDLHEGNKKALPCGAGVAMLAVDHKGELNLCHRFTGSDLNTFGDVHQGPDKPALSAFLEQRLDRSDKGCASCSIRNLCSGGCYHESYARYEDPAQPTWHYCELMRDWVDFGIRVYSQIMAENPAFIDDYISPRRA